MKFSLPDGVSRGTIAMQFIIKLMSKHAWANMRGPNQYFASIRLPQPTAGRTTVEILSKRVTTNLP